MAIKDIQPKTGFDLLEGEVTEIGPVREFQKFGKPGRVCTARLKDESGDCNFSLWNEQIDQVKVGDKVKLENGFASEWQGDVQVSTGRNGSLTVIGSGAAEEPAAEASEETEDSEKVEEPAAEETSEDSEKAEEPEKVEEATEEPAAEETSEDTEKEEDKPKAEDVVEEDIN